MGKKKETYIVKDFGSVTIPERWEDVTLGQFIKLMQLEGDGGQKDVRDVIAVLTNNDREWVNMLPAPFVERLIMKLVFLNKAPDKEPKNELIVNGEKYFINYMDELRFGEYTDINTIIQQDNTNYAAFLAILCRKEGEEYNDDFTAHIEERVKFWESQPITDVMPLVGFFLARWTVSEEASRVYLTEAVEAADQLVEATEHSLKNGGYKRLPIHLRMKAWWNMRKYKKCMRQLSSSISATSKTNEQPKK